MDGLMIEGKRKREQKRRNQQNKTKFMFVQRPNDAKKIFLCQ